jgi:hypothetical protein
MTGYKRTHTWKIKTVPAWSCFEETWNMEEAWFAAEDFDRSYNKMYAIVRNTILGYDTMRSGMCWPRFSNIFTVQE